MKFKSKKAILWSNIAYIILGVLVVVVVLGFVYRADIKNYVLNVVPGYANPDSKDQNEVPPDEEVPEGELPEIGSTVDGAKSQINYLINGYKSLYSISESKTVIIEYSGDPVCLNSMTNPIQLSFTTSPKIEYIDFVWDARKNIVLARRAGSDIWLEKDFFDKNLPDIQKIFPNMHSWMITRINKIVISKTFEDFILNLVFVVENDGIVLNKERIQEYCFVSVVWEGKILEKIPNYILEAGKSGLTPEVILYINGFSTNLDLREKYKAIVYKITKDSSGNYNNYYENWIQPQGEKNCIPKELFKGYSCYRGWEANKCMYDPNDATFYFLNDQQEKITPPFLKPNSYNRDYLFTFIIGNEEWEVQIFDSKTIKKRCSKNCNRNLKENYKEWHPAGQELIGIGIVEQK